MPTTPEEDAAAVEAEAAREARLAATLTDRDWLVEITSAATSIEVADLFSRAGGPHMSAEATRQHDAARDAVLALIAAGGVGTGPYSISARGHATPGHDPAAHDDGTHDAIIITVAATK